MLFMFYQVNAMLNTHSLFIWLHEIMDYMPWQHCYNEHTWPEERMAYHETHRNTIAGLDQLQNWLKNHYLVEATDEWKFICLHGSSLDMIPFPQSYEDQRPGNEGLFYQRSGFHPPIEPTLEAAPLIANTMIEALHHHDQRQSEGRDHQEYLQQQDNTSLPIVDFQSLARTDRKVITITDSPEGAAAAAKPLTTKKITFKEYQHLKALEEAHAATFLDEDEHGKMLDYEDFSSQDDPANIHISSWMPTPAPEEVPEPMPSSKPTTIPKINVSAPGHHLTAAANRAPGFSRDMALSSTLPMQVGMPQVGTSAMSPRKTPAHGTTAEEILLHGSTLSCTLQQEMSLLSSPPLLLTDNHLKMMESLCTLDASGLQFICELIEVV